MVSSINVKKTKVVFYLYSNTVLNDINSVIEINNQQVHYVNSYLYLGTDIPVNNIPCYQRAEHKLKGPKTPVSNLCYTRDSVSSISHVPLVF